MSAELSLSTAPQAPALAARPSPTLPTPHLPRVACFAVQAEADPGLLSRVLGLFAKRGLVPDRWVAQREGRNGDELSIDLQVSGFTPELTDYVARCLRQIPQVRTVLTSEKFAA